MFGVVSLAWSMSTINGRVVLLMTASGSLLVQLRPSRPANAPIGIRGSHSPLSALVSDGKLRQSEVMTESSLSVLLSVVYRGVFILLRVAICQGGYY